jgi:hypothetical protein
MSQVLTALTAVNAKLDLLTEKSILLEVGFKGLKADMEEVKTSSRSNEGRVDELCTVVSNITIDVQRLGMVIVQIQDTQAQQQKDHEQPR